jgi:integrase
MRNGRKDHPVTEERTRKGNLESTISETPNAAGLYEAKVWMGTKADGKPDRRHIQRKSLASVRRRVRELEKERDAGRVTRAGKVPTVREMLDRHLEVVLPSRGRAPTTISSYRSLCEHGIYPRWGGQRADRLLPEHVEDGLAAMLRDGLAPASVRKIYAVLSSAYQLQVDRGNLIRNPCQHVEAPAAPEGEMPSLSQAEARKVILAAAERPNAARWTVGLGSGLRQGEALGLRWEYLNLDSGEMRIWWQLQRLVWDHGCAGGELAGVTDEKARKARQAEIEHACAEPHCKTKPCPKKCSRHQRKCPPPCPAGCTRHARLCPHRKGGGLVLRPIKEKRHKTLWLAPEFTAILREHRNAQFLQRVTADAEWEDGDLVFCQWNGRPVDPRRDWAEWCAILLAAGLPRRRVHAMRHSAATFALQEGVALPVVQEMLGHSDIRITRKYTHVGKPLAQDASSRMGRALGLPQAERS